MNNKIGLGQNTCTSTCASTCEKSIYEDNKIKPEQGAGSVIKSSYDQHISLNDAFSAREINLENILTKHNEKLEITRMFKELPSGGLKPSDYLRLVESHIPEELISSQNFAEIRHLASNFNNDLTSFFGFETRLMNPDARSDYLIAVSARKGQRDALINLIKSDEFSIFLEQPEWRQVAKFAMTWADPHSVLHEKILGLWLEFDTAEESIDKPTPNVFLHTEPLYFDFPEDFKKCTWLTATALPLLTGHPLSKKLEQSFLNCIKRLPKGASLFHVGVMLSRPISSIRVVIKGIRPKQIVQYLKTVGLSYGAKELSLLIAELEKMANRIVLNFDVIENGIGQKIGIECSFYPENNDQYQPEPRWGAFLDYLVEKGLCLPEKRDALINFLPDTNYEYISSLIKKEEPLILATKILDDKFIPNLVRQMGHIKIVYCHNNPLEAKAYFGGRLFGFVDSAHQQPSVMKV